MKPPATGSSRIFTYQVILSFLNNEKDYFFNFNDLNNFNIVEKPIFNLLDSPKTTKLLDTSWVEQKDFAKSYFKNLDSNKIENLDGNCGYTALGMYLTYLDNVFDNNVVDSKYENANNENSSCRTMITNLNDTNQRFESPGAKPTKLRIIDYTSKVTKDFYKYPEASRETEEYKEALEKCSWEFAIDLINEDTLFGYLAKINIENKTIHKKESKEDSYFHGFGVNYDIMINTMMNYLKSNSKISNKFKIITNFISDGPTLKTYQDIRQEIIEHLKMGRALIVGGRGFNVFDENGNSLEPTMDLSEYIKNGYKTSQYGHVCIAYDYDEKNDKIYGNLGWSHEYNHVDLEKSMFNIGITDYYAYEAIDNEIYNHKHKNNFFIQDLNKSVCACQLLSHRHSYSYQNFDENNHLKRCFCKDENLLENHHFGKEIYKDGSYYMVCDECGHLQKELNKPIFIY